MKKIIYISAIAAMAVGTALTSCSDFLEADNKSAGGQTAEKFFSSKPETMLYSAFATLQPIADQEDIYNQGTDLYMNTRGMSDGDFGQYNLSTDNSVIENMYVNCYGLINYANGVLKYVSATSTEAYEARFLRAYGYYLLTQHFGAVPFVTEYIDNASRNYPRVPLETIYPALISDLTELYNSSSLDAQSKHDGHVSKQAVAALLAKINLAAGWDLNTSLSDAQKGTYSISGTNYFSEAASWADKAVSGINLYDNFNDKWLPANEVENQEEIWSVKYERNGYPGDASTGGNSRMFTYGGYYTGEATTNLKYVNSQLQQSEKSMKLFEKGDTRYEGTFMTTCFCGNEWENGYISYYTGASLESDHKVAELWFPYYTDEAIADSIIEAHKSQFEGINANATVTFRAAILKPEGVVVYTVSNGVVKKTNAELSAFNTQTVNGVCVKKFDDPTAAYANRNASYRDIVIFHATDLILTAAEANLMAGNTSGYWTNINKIRNRAGLATIQSISEYDPQYTVTSTFGNTTELDLLLDERARELYAEHSRWEDLRRTKQLVRYNLAFNRNVNTVADMSSPSGEIRWYRPIPQNEIQNNTAMTQADQNPGY